MNDGLTSQLHTLVAEAEARFGPREAGWTLLAAGYVTDDVGYAPRTLVLPDTRLVRIILSENAKGDIIRTRFQLAHGAVHCLAPQARSDTVNIEEGVATLFSTTASGIPECMRHSREHRFRPIIEMWLQTFGSSWP
jgi:hypothetical protein